MTTGRINQVLKTGPKSLRPQLKPQISVRGTCAHPRQGLHAVGGSVGWVREIALFLFSKIWPLCTEIGPISGL
jgi:hypothetical protein